MKILFFIALFGILHTYIFYPFGMRFLGLFLKKEKAPPPPAELPEVEILFAAFNEEKVIEEKIRSSFLSDYPSEKLTVRLGSDASTDRTDGIVKKLQNEFPNLQFTRFEGRTGKADILNQLVQQTQAKFLIFTDANIIFDRETVPALVSKILENPKNGIVGGHIFYSRFYKKGISTQENMYLRSENDLKQIESRFFGKAMGAEGGCYIIRKELFPEIPPRFFMEDFYVSMMVMQQSKNVLFSKKAKCYEDVSVLSAEEYKRKVRISIGNWQNLGRFWKVVFTHFFPTGFIFLSHKILRWFTPFFMLILLITSILLVPSGLFFAAFAGLYMMFIGAGLFGILLADRQGFKIFKWPGHFLNMNLALLEGFTIYLKGVKTNAWQPTKRHQD